MNAKQRNCFRKDPHQISLRIYCAGHNCLWNADWRPNTFYLTYSTDRKVIPKWTEECAQTFTKVKAPLNGNYVQWNECQRRNNEQFNETFKTENLTAIKCPMNWKYNEIIFACCAAAPADYEPALLAVSILACASNTIGSNGIFEKKNRRRVNRSARCDARSANASNASREPMFYSIRLDVGDASLVSTLVLCRAERCTYFTFCPHIHVDVRHLLGGWMHVLYMRQLFECAAFAIISYTYFNRCVWSPRSAYG